MPSEQRDPRLHPMPGDKLQPKDPFHTRREVLTEPFMGFVKIRSHGWGGMRERFVPIGLFRKWAAKAEVIHVAEVITNDR